MPYNWFRLIAIVKSNGVRVLLLSLAFSGGVILRQRLYFPAYVVCTDSPSTAESHSSPEEFTFDETTVGRWIDGLPEFFFGTVRKHRTLYTRKWVVLGEGIFDVTDFKGVLPGDRERMLSAVGMDAAPMWISVTPEHRSAVFAELSMYRVGNLIHSQDDIINTLRDPDTINPAPPSGWLQYWRRSLLPTVEELVENARIRQLQERVWRLQMLLKLKGEKDDLSKEEQENYCIEKVKRLDSFLAENEYFWDKWKQQLQEHGNLCTIQQQIYKRRKSTD